MTQVTIPNSVTSIDYNNFDGCTSLEQVTIPNSVTEIGGSAFEACSELEKVTIPNTIETIDSTAFKECNIIETINITNYNDGDEISEKIITAFNISDNTHTLSDPIPNDNTITYTKNKSQ